MRRAAGFAHGGDLVEKRRPVGAEDMRAGDDDVDLARALLDRVADLGQPQVERHQPRRKAGGDRGDRDAGVRKRPHRRRHHRRIDTDRADRRHRVQPQSGDQILAQWPAGLGAEPGDAVLGVVAGQRRQVHAANRVEQKRCLVDLLGAAPRGQRGGAALGRGAVDAHRREPVAVQCGAGVAGVRHHSRPCCGREA
jgi:hypothetical protein